MISVYTSFCGVNWKENSPQITCQRWTEGEGGQHGRRDKAGKLSGIFGHSVGKARGTTYILPTHLCLWTAQLAKPQPACRFLTSYAWQSQLLTSCHVFRLQVLVWGSGDLIGMFRTDFCPSEHLCNVTLLFKILKSFIDFSSSLSGSMWADTFIYFIYIMYEYKFSIYINIYI